MTRQARKPLLGIVAGSLQHEMQLPADEARAMAVRVVRWMSKVAGGDVVYCPKPATLERAERDEAIRQEFNGRNRDELCERFRVSRSTLYRVIGT